MPDSGVCHWLVNPIRWKAKANRHPRYSADYAARAVATGGDRCMIAAR